jgi:replicative DNA helicase
MNPRLEIIGLALNDQKLIPSLTALPENLFKGYVEEFYFRAIKTLSHYDKEINEYTIGDYVVNHSPLIEEDIYNTIGDSLMTMGDTDSFESVKSHLLEAYASTQVKEALNEAVINVNNGMPVELVSESIISTMINIAEQNNFKNKTISIKEANKLFIDHLEKVGDGSIKKIYTGLSRLDDHLNGIESPDVIYIAARPSMGKTSLATRFLTRIAKNNKEQDNLIFSLETSSRRISEKLNSQNGKVDIGKITKGKLEQEDWDRLSRSCTEFDYFNNIYINDRTDITADEVMAEAVICNSKKKLSSVFLDYLQLLKAPKGQWSREREVAEQSRTMKIMAKRIDSPIFVLSQLNRSLENRQDKEPMMSDLRDSGSIEQDADIVLFIYRDEVYNKQTEEKGIARVIIGKNKRGPTGMVKVGWDGKYSRFFNL